MIKTASRRAPLPPWLKIRPPAGAAFEAVKAQMEGGKLHTVCAEARCPNVAECWGGGTATFMVMGDLCTRACRFCSVRAGARPPLPDPEEPARLAAALSNLDLTYAVITTVCRDDLPDQGAGHIAACIRAIRDRRPDLKIEFLVQDFRGEEEPLRTVVEAAPDVLAHNIETVRRLTGSVRDARAGYDQSLSVLGRTKDMAPQLRTKSSLMLGLGETEDELVETMRDLRGAGVDILTLGQYLRPSLEARHLPVAEFVPPETFARLRDAARSLGFLYAASGPFVRSSYRAGELFMEGLLREREGSRA